MRIDRGSIPRGSNHSFPIFGKQWLLNESDGNKQDSLHFRKLPDCRSSMVERPPRFYGPDLKRYFSSLVRIDRGSTPRGGNLLLPLDC